MIEQYLNTPLIKVLIGQRRVGKSTILKSILQRLYQKHQISLTNIFYINKELPDFDHIKSYDDLKQSFQSFLTTIQPWMIFVWIDEIQDISGWERFINGLLATYGSQIEIFITGSNAFLLSWELATYLTGRYIEFEIFPLNFEEFCMFKQEQPSKDNFIEHLTYGGMPAIFQMNYKKDIIYPYLQWVYNTIVLKDIISHHQIRNIVFFKDLYQYTLANIGNIVSGKSISDYLKSQKIAIGNETVLNFLWYAQETFLLRKIYSVNPETKKYFEIYNKYYVWDLWLRNALVWFNFGRDVGRLLENYVFLELKRHKYSVTIGRLSWWQEIDFIAEKDGLVKYIQVCYLMWNEDTMAREYTPLQLIKDNRPKYILSLDDIDHGIYRGIQHINVMCITDIL